VPAVAATAHLAEGRQTAAPIPAPASMTVARAADRLQAESKIATTMQSSCGSGTCEPESLLNATHSEPPVAATHSSTNIEFDSNILRLTPVDHVARLTVRRAGNLHGDATFTWWTEPGSGKPREDFASFGIRTAHFPDGSDTVNLLVPVVSDVTRRDPKIFFVAIGTSGTGVTLGARARSMVVIPASS